MQNNMVTHQHSLVLEILADASQTLPQFIDRNKTIKELLQGDRIAYVILAESIGVHPDQMTSYRDMTVNDLLTQ